MQKKHGTFSTTQSASRRPNPQCRHFEKQMDNSQMIPSRRQSCYRSINMSKFSATQIRQRLKSALDQSAHCPDLDENAKLDDVSFSEEDNIRTIRELNPYSSTPDGDIPARILVSCKGHHAVPLNLMLTKSTAGPYHPR